MKELNKFIDELKINKEFSKNFDIGYQEFKIGLILKEARINAGLTQEEIALLLKTKKSNISRIENHAEDIKLSTLEKFAFAIGKKIEIKIV